MIVVVVKSLHNPFLQLLIFHDPKHCFTSSSKTLATSTGLIFIISAQTIVECTFCFALPFTTTFINTTCYIITSGCFFTRTDMDSKTFFFWQILCRKFQHHQGSQIAFRHMAWISTHNHQNLQAITLALMVSNCLGHHITLHVHL